MSPMRLVVLGGTGFVGRHLLERLLRDGHRITLLSRNLAARAERLLPRPALSELICSKRVTPVSWQAAITSFTSSTCARRKPRPLSPASLRMPPRLITASAPVKAERSTSGS